MTIAPAPAGPGTSGQARRCAALVLPLALLGLTAACGGNGSTAGTASSSSSSSGSSSSAAAGTTLTGVVGENDAYTISLTDSTGAPVKTLKAGTYTIKVKDASKIHNFHLTGPGVEQKTAVPEVTDTTWTVDLKPGSYTYRCDPHAKMTGSFTVS